MMKWGAEIARRVHGETHPQTVKHLLEVAEARSALADHQAIVETLGPLADGLREQGEERRGELIEVQQRLADAALALADHPAAEASAREALALLGTPEGPARRDAAALRFTLARAIVGRGGDLEESRALAEAALAAYRELADPADADAIAAIEGFLAEAASSGKKSKKKKKKKKKTKKKTKKKKK